MFLLHPQKSWFPLRTLNVKKVPFEKKYAAGNANSRETCRPHTECPDQMPGTPDRMYNLHHTVNVCNLSSRDTVTKYLNVLTECTYRIPRTLI